MYFLAGQHANAQMDSATLGGRVLDSSRASVTSARLELVDTDRGTKTVALTNSVGYYVFPVIRPGHYRLRVSAAGFRTVELTNLTIYTQDDIQELFVLASGSQLDSVTIRAAGVHIATSGTVGTVIDPSLINALPLNGLTFQKLFQLTPGIVTAATSFANQGQFSANGQRTNANYFAIDGVAANLAIAAGIEPGQSAVGSLPALTAFGGTNALISTEDVQEFATLTSSYAAEFGHSPGAQTTIVSRAGTSDFHGDVFDYLRNDVLDANNWFFNRAGVRRAALRQNDFGGVLGGGILKKRIFFFTSFEGVELRQPSFREDLVPSMSARETVPTVLKPFLDAYPVPNGPNEAGSLAQANYSFSNPSILNAESIRIDHDANNSLKTFARYVHSSSAVQQRGAESNALSTITTTRFSLQTLTAGANYWLTGKSINDLRINWSQSSASSSEQLDNFAGAVPLVPSLVLPLGFNQQNSFYQFLPVIGPSNLTLGFGSNVLNRQQQIDLLDNLSYEAGTHLLKAGIDFRWLQPQTQPAGYEQQTLFPDIQSVLTDRPFFTVIGANVPVRGSVRDYSAYLQDSWRPSAHTNLTYGLRWEFSPALTATGSNGLHPLELEGLGNLPSVSLHAGSPLYRSRWNNFAPRVGLTYQPKNVAGKEFIIRLGAGVFYDLSNGPAGNAVGAPFSPFRGEKVLGAEPLPLSSADAFPPGVGLGPPFMLVAFPADLRTPYTYHWNMALERSMGSLQTLTVSEIGALGHSLLRTTEYFAGEAGIPLAFRQIRFTDNSGYSKYNSLQLKFQRRDPTGIHFIAAYSYAHSFDNSSTDAVTDGVPTLFVKPAQDYGPSDFDIRHTLSLGLNYVLHRKPSRLINAILSAWSVDSVLLARSSPPVDVVVSRMIGVGANNFRPDLVMGVPLTINDPTVPGGRIINVAAFSVPAVLREGDIGRNSLRGFPLFQNDLAVSRQFHLTARVSINLRIEAFNLLNHPNFASPVGLLGTVSSTGHFIQTTNFGVSQSMLAEGLQSGSFGSFGSGLSPLYQIGGARNIQIASKIQF